MSKTRSAVSASTPFSAGALDEPPAVRLERVVAALAAHRPPQPLRLPHREAGERDRDLEHLVLEDDDAERRAQRLAQELVVDRPDVARVLAQPLPRVDVRVHRLPLDRPRPHERDLDGDVVEVLGLRAQEALHLRAALDLERADRVRALDVVVDRGVVERDAGEVDRPRRACRAICSTQSSTAESIPRPSRSILRKPASEHESLSHWQSWRPAIAAGWTGTSSTSGRVETIIPPGCCETWRGSPAISPVSQAKARQRCGLELAVTVRKPRELLPHALRVPAVREPREPLELRERQAERLADVADRAARAVRREARDERGVLAPVALGDADDELLADVAREVEVDVRHRRELAVQEAPERELVRDRVDVREAGEVADDRADRAPAPAARRQEAPRRVRAAHLARALARELEHLVVEEEEPGEPELVDERELALEASARPAL